MDFAAAGLLDGLEGEERAARERLLEQLAEAGFTQAELQDAVAEERLALLPVDRALQGQHTAKEIEERTGLPAEMVLRVRRLLGLPEARPDDRVFRDEDIKAAESAKLFLDAGLGEDAIAEVTRVLGEGMARLAATTAAAFVGAFLKPGDTEQDIATRFPELAEQLSQALSPVLISAYNAHLRESVRRGMIGRVEREHGSVAGAQQMTICFADLVGFTRLGGETEATELGSVAGKLAELAAEVAERPVRLVKTIGDAAMFVSQEPGPMVAAALDLVEAVEEQGLPSVRAGIACGKALQRAGDFYGHPVNVASRVTGVARPGSVLCTREVHEAAPDEFDWSSAGKHRLKGVEGSVPLFRARRLSIPEQDGDHGPSKKRKADRRRKSASS
jgi:adenylate cyclase